ncbi:MAG: desulfoferrodoxin [Candidatus Pacearchaeota archaeon]
MTKLNEVYRCSICGNIVEIVNESSGNLYCCGKEMSLLIENTTEASTEKHIPVKEKIKDRVIVKVGSIPHPMEDSHYIQWVEIVTKDNKSIKKFLSPGDKPEAEFFEKVENILYLREYCNIHGLWKS